MIDSIDDAAALLYAGPLDGFVAGRDALAKEVRAGGDRSLADAIKALRKPTVAADALNRAIRADQEALDHLLDAVDRLRGIQEAMLAGEEADFGAAQTAYRRAVEAVAGAAPSHEIEVRAALEAAAVGGLADELRAAAFASLPGPSGGFGPFAVGAGTSATHRGRHLGSGSGGPDGDRSGDPVGDRPPAGRRGPSAAERRLAQRARRAAEQALAEAESDQAAAVAAATAAADELTAVDQELAHLTERIEATRRARDDAVVVRAQAEAALAGTTGAVDEARAALDDLDRHLESGD